MACPLDSEFVEPTPGSRATRVALARFVHGHRSVSLLAAKTKEQSSLNPSHNEAPAEAGAFDPPKFRRNQYFAVTGAPQPQLNL
jgi:hypothetical protein